MSNIDVLLHTIGFVKHNFNYQIKYDTKLDETIITVTHMDEFYSWRKIISSNLLGIENVICLTISPKILFSIFYNYAQNELHELTKLEFPKDYEDSELLIIMIKTISPYNDEDVDNKYIFLENIKVPLEERLQKKLDRRDQKIKNQQNEINSIHEKINDLFYLIRYIKKEQSQILNFCSENVKEQNLFEKQILDHSLYLDRKISEMDSKFEKELKNKDDDIERLKAELYQNDKQVNDVERSLMIKFVTVEDSLTDKLTNLENEYDTLATRVVEVENEYKYCQRQLDYNINKCVDNDIEKMKHGEK